MKLTGAQALIKSLEMEHVEVMFGLPGGCILPAYDPILDSPIRHILVRHEQGAGHMAEGYAHVTGRPGVAMVTSGPAATNLVTPAVRRLHGLGADGGHHRPGEPAGDRHRRLPGVRHGRHHPVGDQAQRADHGPRRDPPARPPGLPPGHHRPARPGPPRRAQGRAAGRDRLVVADRRRRGRLAARLQAHHQRPSPHDQGSRPPDQPRPAGRSSTPAAASSRPGPPRPCASWPS